MAFISGIISGIVSGLGMGGGTILIFLLSNVVKVEQHISQAANLIFFIPTSIGAIWTNLKNKNIDLKLANTVSFFGVIGAIIGAKVSTKTNVEILKKIFGIFIMLIAVIEIYMIIKEYIKNKNKE